MKRYSHDDNGEISQERKNLIFRRDNYTCKKCGSREKLTIDHILPRKHGGTIDPENLQTLCSYCNNNKSSIFDYVEVLRLQRSLASSMSREFLQLWYQYPATKKSKYGKAKNCKVINGTRVWDFS